MAGAGGSEWTARGCLQWRGCSQPGRPQCAEAGVWPCRGAAHLGALRALAPWGLEPAAVVGASAGGLVAGALASDVPLEDMIALAREVCRHPFRSGLAQVAHALAAALPVPAPGLLTLAPMITRLLERCRRSARTVVGWRENWAVLVTELASASVRVFDRTTALVPAPGQAPVAMDAAEALQATSAFPGLLAGVHWGGELFADGGILDDVPADACFRCGVERVLAIEVADHAGALPPSLTLPDMLQRAMAMVGALSASAIAAQPGPVFTLRPVLPPGAGLLSFGLFEQVLQAG